jgi:hypothetical protein
MAQCHKLRSGGREASITRHARGSGIERAPSLAGPAPSLAGPMGPSTEPSDASETITACTRSPACRGMTHDWRRGAPLQPVSSAARTSPTVRRVPRRRGAARESAREGESLSATVARLIELGARAERGERRPRYVATGEGPEDLGRAAERYLNELVEAR